MYLDQAGSGRSDVIATLHESSGTTAVYFDGVEFVSNSNSGPNMTFEQVKNVAAAAGQFVTFTAVPPGSGQRMALDRDQDGHLDGDDVCPAVSDTSQLDSDADGVGDACDRCIVHANADQRDTNGDGYGNICDPDLNNDGVVNFGDVFEFSTVFLSQDPDADFNGDGVVNFGDFALLPDFIFSSPGPSAIAQ